ncbi:MAG: sugar phosphate isomerase/epimerase [Bacteroidia bacterium]|nr:sugar phosphate isomerase/epimerase [Bacteroidia bacterium]
MKPQKSFSSVTSRRKFIAQAAALSAAVFLPMPLSAGGKEYPLLPSAVPGVNLGAITYSFRSMPGSADDLLGYLVKLGLNSVELMGEPAEAFAGAPTPPPWTPGPPTPEQQAERKKFAEEMRKWRLSAPMDRFKVLRKKYKAEGVAIEVIKFPMDRLTDEEIDYCFRVAKTVGAKGITLERSDEAAARLGSFADRHKRLVGYHNHAKVNFNSWDKHLADAKYNAMNLDVGHYVAGTNQSPIELIQKYPDRILNLHLKDRKFNEGPNMPWGQGDTPLKEILQLLRQEKYRFLAAIELEYPIPDGSDAVKEVGKCIEFCREALG